MNNEVEAYPGELRELRVRVRVLGDHMRACDRDAADIEMETLTFEEDKGSGDHPAKYAVFWPGQTVHVCQRHFDGLSHLSAAMGSPPPGFHEEAGNQCQNCVNEAKKECG